MPIQGIQPDGTVHLGVCRSTTSMIFMSISHGAGDQHWQMRQATPSQRSLHQHTAALCRTAGLASSSSLAAAGKHERLCAAAAKLRPERRRSASPDYAGASMHSGARRVLLDSLMWHGMDMAPVGHSSGKRRCISAEALRSDEREHQQRMRCRQASCMHP